MLKRLFKPRPAQIAGRALYARVVAQARDPALYAQLGTPDTVEGRFELYSLHIYLILERLKGQGPLAADTAQSLFDTYVSALDHALREMGVGDLSVGKRMRKLGEAFYGRVNSYEQALAALPDTTLLEALLARTVYEGADSTQAPQMAAYVIRQRESLAIQPLEALSGGERRTISLAASNVEMNSRHRSRRPDVPARRPKTPTPRWTPGSRKASATTAPSAERTTAPAQLRFTQPVLEFAR